MIQPVQGILGVLVMLCVAWLCSEKRRLVSWRFVALGMLVQVALATVLLKLPAAVVLFQLINRGVAVMEKATQAGTSAERGKIHVFGPGQLDSTCAITSAGTAERSI